MTPPLTTTLDEAAEHVYCSRCRRWLPIPARDHVVLEKVRDLLRQDPPLWGDARRLITKTLAAQPAPPAEALRLLRELVAVAGLAPGALKVKALDEARRYLAANEEGT